MMAIQSEIDRMQQEQIIRVKQEVRKHEEMAVRHQELARLQAVQEVEEAGKLVEINLTLNAERQRAEKLHEQLIIEASLLEKEVQAIAQEFRKVQVQEQGNKEKVLRNE
jgi:hypothetical protein